MRNSKKCLFLIGACLLISSVNGFNEESSSKSENFLKDSRNLQENFNQNDYESVYDYKQTFKKYYDQVKKTVNEQGKEICWSFDKFCENYYNSGLNLDSYLDYVIEISLNDFNPEQIHYSSSSGSEDADYIMSGTYTLERDGGIDRVVKYQYDGEITPLNAFSRELRYFNYYYGDIRAGDILVETHTHIAVLDNIGHAAIVSNPRKLTYKDYDKIHYADDLFDYEDDYMYYIQTIEAVGSGVKYGFLDDNRMIEYGVVILRPKQETSTEQINKMLKFMKSQLLKPYNVNFVGFFNPMEVDPTANSWYCSELAWAAYKYAGVDISDAINCWPSDLLYSNYLKKVTNNRAVPIYPELTKVRETSNGGLNFSLRLYNLNNYGIDAYICKTAQLYEEAETAYKSESYEKVYISAGGFIDRTYNGYANGRTASFYFKDRNDPYIKYLTYCSKMKDDLFSNIENMHIAIQTNQINTRYPLVRMKENNSSTLKFRIYNENSYGVETFYKNCLVDSYGSVFKDVNNKNTSFIPVPASSYKDVTVNKNGQKYASFVIKGDDGNNYVTHLTEFTKNRVLDLNKRLYSSGLDGSKTVEINGIPDSRYYEDRIYLLPNQSVVYTFKFKVGGEKFIQTFGRKGTVIEELYPNGYQTYARYESGGFAKNASFRAIFGSNLTDVTLKIRVKFSNAYDYGELKVSITPTTNGNDGPLSNSVRGFYYNDILKKISYTSVNVFPTSNAVMRLYINKKARYTIYTQSSLDTYLYLVDPYDMDTYCDDDSAGDRQAKIETASLRVGYYYLVVSTWSMTQSGVVTVTICRN